MKYLFVRQIDFVNARYVKIRNFSEGHVVLGWQIQDLFLPRHRKRCAVGVQFVHHSVVLDVTNDNT